MGMILVTASVAVFVWAVVGLIRPTWARLPSRAASVGVWVLSVVLFIIGGAMLPPTPEPAPVAESASAVSTPVDSRVHPESAFPESVAVLIAEGALAESVTQARAYHNDLELTLSAAASDVLAAASCDQQRDYVASQWLKWNKLDVGRGSGITLKSSTGRVLASVEEGFTGPQFHCD